MRILLICPESPLRAVLLLTLPHLPFSVWANSLDVILTSTPSDSILTQLNCPSPNPSLMKRLSAWLRTYARVRLVTPTTLIHLPVAPIMKSVRSRRWPPPSQLAHHATRPLESCSSTNRSLIILPSLAFGTSPVHLQEPMTTTTPTNRPPMSSHMVSIKSVPSSREPVLRFFRVR